MGKFGLRALAQSLAREFSSQGIQVAHIVIDGQINTPRVQAMALQQEQHTLLAPEAIAQTYWQLYQRFSGRLYHLRRLLVTLDADILRLGGHCPPQPLRLIV